MKRNSRNAVVIILSVLYFALLGYMIFQSLSPAESSSGQSGMITALLSNIGLFEKLARLGLLDDFVRKTIGHFCEFALLGAIGYALFFYLIDGDHCFLINCGVGLLSCAIVESMQFFAAGRAPSFFDVVLDFQGYTTALSSLTILLYILDLIRKRNVKILAKKYSFSLPAYVFAIAPFCFYGGNSVGVYFSFFTFIVLFSICSIFTLIISFKRKKIRS